MVFPIFIDHSAMQMNRPYLVAENVFTSSVSKNRTCVVIVASVLQSGIFDHLTITATNETIGLIRWELS